MPRVFKRLPLTDRLVKYLSQFEMGAQIGYDELSRITGQTVTSGTPSLAGAKKLLRKEHMHVWVAVRNAGIKRCTDQEIAERQPNWFIRGTSRKLKRGSKEAQVIDLKQLSPDQQSKLGVHCLQQHLASQALSRQFHNRVAKVSGGNSNDLPKFDVREWAVPLNKRS